MKESDKEFIDLLIEAVEETFGRKPKSPTDFNQLSAAIADSGPYSIGNTTLKRLWGYIGNPNKPTYSTLTVLARYAGYRDWDSFCFNMRNHIDSGFTADGVIMTAEEPIGVTLRVEWGGRKWCEIKKIDQPSEFEVLASHNIKILPGDLVHISAIAVGERFIATDCKRSGRTLGSYIGARGSGIERISRV